MTSSVRDVDDYGARYGISFGDNVCIRRTAETERLGYARIGWERIRRDNSLHLPSG